MLDKIFHTSESKVFSIFCPECKKFSDTNLFRAELGKVVDKIISRGRGGVGFCEQCGRPRYSPNKKSSIYVGSVIIVDGKIIW